jgi:plastocyanin
MADVQWLGLRALASTLGVIAIAGAAAGCGDSREAQTADVQSPVAMALKARTNSVVTAAPTNLILRLDEYRITPPKDAVPKGALKVTVVNHGKKRHHVLLVELGPHGRRIVGALPQVTAGGAAARTFVLRAGAYMLICNVPGHYHAGMRSRLIVRDR